MIISDTLYFVFHFSILSINYISKTKTLLLLLSNQVLFLYRFGWYWRGKHIMILRQNHRAHPSQPRPLLQSVLLQHVLTTEYHNTIIAFPFNSNTCWCLHIEINLMKETSCELDFKETNVTLYRHQQKQNLILGFITRVIRPLRFKYGALKILQSEE